MRRKWPNTFKIAHLFYNLYFAIYRINHLNLYTTNEYKLLSVVYLD